MLGSINLNQLKVYKMFFKNLKILMLFIRQFLPFRIQRKPALPKTVISSKPYFLKQSEEKISLEIVEEIFSFFDVIDPFYEGMNVKKELRIEGAWKKILLDHRKNQLQSIRNKNFEKMQMLMENLFFNELVRGLWNWRYYDGAISLKLNLPYQFADESQVFEKITSTPVDWLASSEYFDVWGAKTKKGVIKYPSLNHGIQAFNIKNLIGTFKSKNKNNIKVLDLGSGYGGMAEYLMRYKPEFDQEISIFLMDIPLNLTIAYGYLSKIFGTDNVFLIKSKKELSELNCNDQKIYLIPTCFIDSLYFNLDIVNNFQSFSEMDISTVNFYIDQLTKNNPKFLIENNVNKPNSKNYSNFNENIVRNFKIPPQYSLLTRFSASETWSRYVTSIYVRNQSI